MDVLCCGRYAGPLTAAQPKLQRDGDVMLAASLAAEQAAAAKRAGDDPFADLGVSFVEVRNICTAVMPHVHSQIPRPRV